MNWNRHVTQLYGGLLDKTKWKNPPAKYTQNLRYGAPQQRHRQEEPKGVPPTYHEQSGPEKALQIPAS
ncbi:protein of unknown function [Candidatus Filomicrobium marinum]|uniref:Uncharacterized protein n=1 Tax=Candidatus Filomicrobium marinum TaxID=1608628 RepID=A0A0D6JL27_9HYPH|nr:protein of unknown function [Candidatus Filomicrobium marinum]CPR22365.1 protein of unknown function [Candidatus Filomicrobium marinum]